MGIFIEIIGLKIIQAMGIICVIVLPIYIIIWINESIEKIITYLKYKV